MVDRACLTSFRGQFFNRGRKKCTRFPGLNNFDNCKCLMQLKVPCFGLNYFNLITASVVQYWVNFCIQIWGKYGSDKLFAFCCLVSNFSPCWKILWTRRTPRSEQDSPFIPVSMIHMELPSFHFQREQIRKRHRERRGKSKIVKFSLENKVFLLKRIKI